LYRAPSARTPPGQVSAPPCRSGVVPRSGGTLIRTSTRRAAIAGLALFALAAATLASTTTAAFADGGGNGVPEYRHIVFPVQEHVDYTDTFGDCRDGCSRHHLGNDLIGQRLFHELSTVDGTVTWMVSDASGTGGNWLE